MAIPLQAEDPLVGRQLDRRYRLTGLLARGGMATVYTAVDERLDRPVAVKVMHPALADDPGFVARFTQEARSAARLSAPEVVAVFDQGRDEASGAAYLVMEHVQGRDLREVLRRRGALPPERALSVLEPVLRALAAAHRAGIVHRDVKPENVLLADDGRVKVADFGLASAVEASERARTTGLLLGTVAYLAPEQIERGAADTRSDVYAAGILLWEALTGVPPFSGDTAMQVAFRHVHEDVPAPSTVVPGIPAALDDLVVRATRRDPARRPQDAGQFLAELRALPPSSGRRAPSSRQDTLVVPRPGGPGHPLDQGAGSGPREGHDRGARRPTASAPLVAGAGRQRPGPIQTGPTQTGPAPTGGAPQPSAASGAPRTRRRRRAPLAVLAVLLVGLLAGGGVWWASAGRFTSAPGVLALPQAQAEQRLESVGLHVQLAPAAYDETVPTGSVLDQDPSPGGRVRKGGTVEVTISKGPDRRTVPSTLVGATQDAATQALEGVGLRVGTVTEEFSSAPLGSVLRSDPAPGTALRPDTPVALVVSKGVEQLPVPDVRGQPQAQAVAAVQGAGFTPTVAQAFSDTVASGLVIDQSPDQGIAGRGSAVALTVSKGPDVVKVPALTGKSKDQALAALEAVGLKGRAIDLPFIGNTVVVQQPSAGATVKRGSTVTFGVS